MYQPKPPPFDAKGLTAYVYEELQAISQSQGERVDLMQLNVLHVEPTKRRAGMIVCADGTDWQPLGAGGGFFGYFGGAWVKLNN